MSKPKKAYRELKKLPHIDDSTLIGPILEFCKNSNNGINAVKLRASKSVTRNIIEQVLNISYVLRNLYFINNLMWEYQSKKGRIYLE